MSDIFDIKKNGGFMIKLLIMMSCMFILFFIPLTGIAQQQDDLTIIRERLAKLEEGQVSLNKRFDDMNANMNKRFEDVNRRLSDMNSRFSDMNSRFDDVMTWLQIMTTVLGLVFVGIFGTMFLMWRKIVFVEGKVVTLENKIDESLRFKEKERAMIFQDERLRKLEEDMRTLKETVLK